MRLGMGILASLLLLIMAGCNPAEDSGNNTGSTDSSSSSSTDSSSSASSSGDMIKIGFNFEETGNAATFGTSSHTGAEMAVDEINEAGGILGKQITAIFDDNASKSDEAAKVATKHVSQDKVDVIIGAVASSNSIAMAKIAEENKVPMVTPASTNPDVTLNEDGSVRRYVFRTCFTDDFQGEGMVKFAVDPDGPIGASRAAVLYDKDNDYSVGIYNTILAVAPDAGLEIVAEDSFLSSTETDFRSKLNRFKGTDFDVLIVPGYYNQAALIANQAREVGLTQPLMGGDGFDSPKLYEIAQDNIVGSYFTNHYASDDEDPAVQEFISKYKRLNGGQVPDAMAILAYDAVYAVKQVYETAGSTDKEAFVDEMAKLQNFKGAAGVISINEHHNATKKLVVLEIKDEGKFEWVYSYTPSGSGGSNPCGDNPCAGNPCGDNPCGENPCGDNPCGH